MKVKLKAINVDKQIVFNKISEIINEEPVIIQDTFIFEIKDLTQWHLLKNMIDVFATFDEILIIVPE